MKRILSVLAIAAVAALAGVLVGQASHAGGKSTRAASASVTTANEACPPGCPPEKCAPDAECPAMTGSPGASATHADLSSGSSCPYSGGAGCSTDGAPRSASNTAVAAATR